MTDLNRKQFVDAAHAAAHEAMGILTNKEKVNFALALLMKSAEPDACATIRHAANQLTELSNILMREAFESECG